MRKPRRMKKRKAKKRRRKREGGRRSNIKDEAGRSKIVICGEVENAVWGFLETPTNWMSRQIGSLGDSGDGRNHYMRQKNKNRFDPPRIHEIGTIGTFGRMGDPGHTRDSGDMGDLGNSENSRDREIVTCAEVGDAAGPKTWRADELGN